MPTIRQICADALEELGALAAGETMSAADGAKALRTLNRMFDAWNAERAAVYCETFTRYTLTPNLAPHTIGPSTAIPAPTWTAAHRPVTLESASLVLDTSTPDVLTPIVVRGPEWWAAQSVPDLASSIPTDVYYEPDWPLGKLYFWPVPTVAYEVELQTRVILADVALGDEFSMPPGYEEAVVLALAKRLARPFARPLSADLDRDAERAIARVWVNNDLPRALTTKDVGMPTRTGGAYFNWLTGQNVTRG